MKIVTAAEMREIDRATSAQYGVPSITLMENAGTAVADFVVARYSQAKRIGVICGKGNNGGDGFVAARKLHDAGREVRVLLLADPSEVRGDAAAMLERLPGSPAVVRSWEELNEEPAQAVYDSDLLLDAILGTGFKPPVSALYAEAIVKYNSARAPVIAIDIPSGANADTMIPATGVVARADAVVTFTAPRPAHVFGQLTQGPIIVAPIGSPDEAVASTLQLNVITPADIPAVLAPRPAESNKGNYGHVLVVGGSVGKAGSVAMAGMAALRAGAGLCTVGTPKSALPTVAGFHPELMTEALEETEAGTISKRAMSYGHLDAVADGKTVLAIGPGISRHAETVELVRNAVTKYRAPMVLDADGLNAFAGRTNELDGEDRTLVITPHPGEMARLAGITIAEVQADRLKIARRFARERRLTVVLKGHRTLIAMPDGTVWVNTTGNPGMATGGAGDILTGMTAGLLAQNPKRVLEAIIAAVHLHGLAGDVACEAIGEHSLTATDLMGALPEAFRRAQHSLSAKAACL